jgi:hypothetical protein
MRKSDLGFWHYTQSKGPAKNGPFGKITKREERKA